MLRIIKKFMSYLIKSLVSSSEVSGAVFVPEEPDDENYLKTEIEFSNLMI